MKKALFILITIFAFACSPEPALPPTSRLQPAGDRAAGVTFTIPNQNLTPGQTVEARFSVAGFADLVSFQFAMQYDTSKLTYLYSTDTGIIPEALYLSVNWEEYFLAPGEVRVAWVHSYAGGVTIPDNTYCFSLFFTAKTAGNLAAAFPFWPDNYVFPPEAADSGFNILPLTVTYLSLPANPPGGNGNPKKKKRHN